MTQDDVLIDLTTQPLGMEFPDDEALKQFCNFLRDSGLRVKVGIANSKPALEFFRRKEKSNGDSRSIPDSGNGRESERIEESGDNRGEK